VDICITAAFAAGLIALCVHGARVAKREATTPRNPLPMVDLGGIPAAAKPRAWRPFILALQVSPYILFVWLARDDLGKPGIVPGGIFGMLFMAWVVSYGLTMLCTAIYDRPIGLEGAAETQGVRKWN
jgi:hypothetical protein